MTDEIIWHNGAVTRNGRPTAGATWQSSAVIVCHCDALPRLALRQPAETCGDIR